MEENTWSNNRGDGKDAPDADTSTCCLLVIALQSVWVQWLLRGRSSSSAHALLPSLTPTSQQRTERTWREMCDQAAVSVLFQYIYKYVHSRHVLWCGVIWIFDDLQDDMIRLCLLVFYWSIYEPRPGRFALTRSHYFLWVWWKNVWITMAPGGRRHMNVNV